jgi:hypothetical protein
VLTDVVAVGGAAGFGALGDDADAAEHAADHEAGALASDQVEEGDEVEFSEGRELSKWSRRWWGAFAEPGCSSPEDPAWEKQIIAEESGEKHA